MAQRLTLLLLIPHLEGGGAERVISLLARGLSPSKYELHLGLITRQNSASESLPRYLTVHALGVSHVRTAAIPLVRLIRNLKPDLILSGIAHLNFLVSLLRPLFPRKTRVLVRQNGSVSATSKYLPAFNRALYKLLYPRADAVICQTPAMKSELASLIGDRANFCILPNPLDIATIRSAAQVRPKSTSGPHVLSIGRLSHEKGLDLLLDAFATLLPTYPNAHLTILGVGAEASNLQNQCRALKIKDSVRFVGYVTHPEQWFADATLFVLPSRQEGLPNALLEAAAAGLPIVALPSSEGLVALIRDQLGIWLADEISTAALVGSMQSALQSIQHGDRFKHVWINEFAMDRAILRYESLIDATISGKQR